MDTVRSSAPAHSGREATHYAARLIAWSLALFGLLRLPWVGAHILLPVTRLQAAAGSAIVGSPSLPVEATLACSGADALALCFAAILAYPARWRLRIAGLACGTVAILALNTIRIGTLGRAAASPRWFEALHVYVWPALLTLAIAGFVFAWMRWVDRAGHDGGRVFRPGVHGGTEVPPSVAERIARPDWLVRGRFALLAAAFLLLFTLAAPLYLESAAVLAVAGMVAGAAAFLLGVLGVDATAAGAVLATRGGPFLVTQECIATPLIPIYLAAVVVYSRTWGARALWTTAAVPLFLALGVARLLVVAVPAGVATPPAFFVHAFFQLLVAVGMVSALAFWRYGARAGTLVRAIAALVLAIAFVRWLGGPYTQAIVWASTSPAPVQDAQGALTFLPAFQTGLFLALWVAAFVPRGWTRFLGGLSLLAALQIVVSLGVHLLAVHAAIVPLVRDVRAWALVGPALVIAAVVNVASPRR